MFADNFKLSYLELFVINCRFFVVDLAEAITHHLLLFRTIHLQRSLCT